MFDSDFINLILNVVMYLGFVLYELIVNVIINSDILVEKDSVCV